MLYPNIKPSEISCQPFSENQFNFNPEDRLLADCREYCSNIIQQENSPWQCHANLMAYWNSKGQTKISKLQKKILHYLHQWHFSKGNPAYLKTRNLARKVKSNRANTITAITRLTEREILMRLEYWSEKYQRPRSIILPKLHMTLKEKLVFQLGKLKHPFLNYIQNNFNELENKRKHPPKVTQTGGCLRYFGNTLKSLRIQKCNIYINILYINYLCTNNLLSLNHLITLNVHAPAKRQGHDHLSLKNFVPINPLHSNAKGSENMQFQLKPKRITLKVQGEITCPSSIDETINILKKKDFKLTAIPQVTLSDLLYYMENKIFSNYGDNNPNLQTPNLGSFFRPHLFERGKFIEQYDSKLFKMMMQLFTDNQNFQNLDTTLLTKKIIGYWSACARNHKNKNNTKFINHSSNLKTQVGFKIYIGVLYHLHYTLTHSKLKETEGIHYLFPMEYYEQAFKTAINRFFNYCYVLKLPKKVAFDVALIDHNNSDRFLKCLTLPDDEFYDFVNASKMRYQAKPETERSLTNFKQIFVESFYEKNKAEGNKRFEQYRPSFSRFLEILIKRIGKYSDNGKCVELCGLKLTAETPIDMPVLYYYMEWLKQEIFSETVFKFDEMFALGNWNNFIKGFMRNERGYSNYWKIVDRN